MKYLITICCKRKRRSPESLPAVRRYWSRRIQFVQAESKRLNRPFLILSGQYGLLSPEEPIPWYDHVLRDGDVEALARVVAGQMRNREVTEFVFYARPRTTAGWAPYFAGLELACRQRSIPLSVRLLDSSYL